VAKEALLQENVHGSGKYMKYMKWSRVRRYTETQPSHSNCNENVRVEWKDSERDVYGYSFGICHVCLEMKREMIVQGISYDLKKGESTKMWRMA
jgi:hypothetical protein